MANAEFYFERTPKKSFWYLACILKGENLAMA
jgi:hypothetical protein